MFAGRVDPRERADEIRLDLRIVGRRRDLNECCNAGNVNDSPNVARFRTDPIPRL